MLIDVDELRFGSGLGDGLCGGNKRIRHGQHHIPGRTPEAIKAKRSASVPLLTPTQWPASQKVANAFSNSSTIDPPTKLAVRNPLRKMPTSSFSNSRWGATRSRKGTASDSMELSAGSMKRSTLAGFPATIALRGTSLVTTLPAPTIAFSLTVVLGRILAPEPIDAPFFITVRSTFQSASVCSLPSAVVARG